MGTGMRRHVIATVLCCAAGIVAASGYSSAAPSGPTASSAVVSGRGYRTIVPAGSKMRPLSVGGTAPLIPAPSPKGPSPLQQVTGFNGIRSIQALSPADPTGAVGTNFVLTAVNTDWELWNRNGLPAAVHATLKSLFPSVRMEFFDPKVVYDPWLYSHQGGFVLVFLGFKGKTQASTIFTAAVPDSPAATSKSSWCLRKVPGDQYPGNGAQWSDYPAVGFDQNRVWISTNLFGFGAHGGFFGSQVLGFANGTIDCTASPSSPFKMYGSQTAFPGGGKALVIQPAVTVGTSGVTTTEYMTSFEWSCPGGSCRGSKLGLWTVHDGGGTPVVAESSITTPTDQMPLYGTQENRSGINDRNFWWDTGDLRLVNAWYDTSSGHLYTAHATSNDIVKGDGYREATIRWFDVAAASGGSLSRTGIVGTQFTDAGWPVVGTDGSGNLYVAYSRASDSPSSPEYLSAWVATVPPGANVPDAILELSPGAGQATYNFMPTWSNYGIERWGDFNAISIDPTDPSKMWVVDQYVPPGPGRVTSDFQQVVGEVTHP